MGTILFDKEIGQKWIAALRSGKYKQGFGYLKNQGCYCALGVLGVVCGYDQRLIGTILTPSIIHSGQRLYNYLTAPIEGNSFEAHIMWMNDNEKKDFYSIADWLEQNLMWDE